MIFNPRIHQDMMFGHLIGNDIAALFVDMGLGKTASCLQALVHLISDGSCRGALVVAPLRVSVLTWPHEVEKWDNFKWLTVANMRTKKGQEHWRNGTADIYTINYESLPKFTKMFLHGQRASQLPIDTIIFDELDNAKNPGSKRINAYRKHNDKISRRWGMTGTPVSNNRLDLFAQIRLLDGGERWKCAANPTGKAYGKWKRQYFEVENEFSEYPKYVPRPGSEQILENKIADMTLVLSAADYLEIPPVSFHDIPVTLPPDAKKLYAKVEKELLALLDDEFEIVAVNAAVLTMKLLQITSGAVYVQQGDDVDSRRPEIIHDAKIKALKQLQKQHDGKPLLIPCQYKHEIQRILDEFPGAEKFKNDRLQAWNNGEIPVMVAHPKSIGHGLNLQDGGNIICWFSLGYSRALYDQMNARLARQGQTRETLIYRLICPGTVDDAVAAALNDKDNDQAAFLETLKNLRRLAEK